MANGKLTNKQQRFVDEYLQSSNATDAARKAGYKGDAKQLSVIGAQNLGKLSIATIIKERSDESGITVQETLQGLAEIARGSIFDFITIAGGVPVIDFEKAELEGQLHLIKKLTMSKGKITFELYDKQRALETFAKHHGLLASTLKIETWQDRAIQDIKQGNIEFDELAEEFDIDLATQLFARAGVRVSLSEATE